MRSTIGLFLTLLILFSACRKDERITADPNARLSFSVDTILFDTVFTSIGSTIRKIKILNKNSDALKDRKSVV